MPVVYKDFGKWWFTWNNKITGPFDTESQAVTAYQDYMRH